MGARAFGLISGSDPPSRSPGGPVRFAPFAEEMQAKIPK
jgi:hypothetical protein